MQPLSPKKACDVFAVGLAVRTRVFFGHARLHAWPPPPQWLLEKKAKACRTRHGGYFTFLRYRNQACEGKYGQNGTCVTEQECGAKQGTDIGRCAEGYGVCCRVSFTCNMVSSVNETEFVNPSYPSGEVGTGTCEVTITKTPDICQLRLDFLEFSLAPPDEQGLCNVDSFMVRSTVGENLPQLCGENNGQHLYVDMGRQSGNPVVLSVISRGGKRPRRWRIKISMIQCGSLDIVPPGCLQYFRSPSAIVRSFNYGPPVDSKVRYLSGLRYSICLRVEENFCSIKWETETNSSFSWGQPTYEDNVVSCRDDFITVDQGSTYGMGPGEDRFCGTRLHEKNVLIYRLRFVGGPERKQVRQQVYRMAGPPRIRSSGLGTSRPASSAPAYRPRQTTTVVESSPHALPRISRRHDLERFGRCTAPWALAGIINLLRYQNQPCEGRNNQNGTCVSEQDCIDRKGTEVNRCANGFGVCCYVSFTCGKSTSDNETEFVNPNYPNGENGTDTCQVTIEKQNNVCQLRLDFLEFSLAQPDENGQCITDSFMVRTTVGERLPILCGENAGLHLYVDMGRSSGNPVVLSVVSNGDKMTRRWRIKISMVQCNSLDIGKSGLILNEDPHAIVRSFNYGPMVEHRVRYLSNLRYSICIRMEENYCSIKWETESNSSFSWGKPIDRGANGTICNMDDFVGIDQGSTLGLGPGQDRFCGTSLGEENVIIYPDLIAGVEVNLPAALQRASLLGTRRCVKKEFQAGWLLRAITCIDLTTLSGDDTYSNVYRLCSKAAHPLREDILQVLGVPKEDVTTGAVCVYPARVADCVKAFQAIQPTRKIPIAAVATGFPSGQYSLPSRLQEIEYAVESGASEIDIVINPHRRIDRRLGNRVKLLFVHLLHVKEPHMAIINPLLPPIWTFTKKAVYNEVCAMKKACGEAHLKTILATGELGSLRNVYTASMVCMMAGADFIKTSTGKEGVNAILPVGITMARAIWDYYSDTKIKVGFKPAGGIRTAKDALLWQFLMKEELGDDWLLPDLFRIGASGLLGDIERQLFHYATKRYASLSEMPAC
ncbi:hypothetical protein HPB50_023774 [Hyalomma asiaticum]|uniref:Uncharacterized protein n=1 Tax=Hyalomma asiaticum TaxID=266040 RepID=A0ACB7RTG2_HYAAI|nr:hypothetical protein HPB50_023774 [Hyalomma asiaticum]